MASLSARLVLLLGCHGFHLDSKVPTTTLAGVSGDVDFPLVGLGTWLYNNSITEAAVKLAFENGYRHVDTAYIYENHVGVGRALKAVGLSRSEFFVTSKIPGGLNATASAAALAQSLHDLNLSYVDLMLVHFPATMDEKAAGGPEGRRTSWRALEEFAKAGKARAIGVSHYCPQHLEDILPIAPVPVALNQGEYHVGMGSGGPLADDGRQFMDSVGVKFMSFSSLCGPCPPPHNTELIHGDLVTSIGAKHNKTGAQVALRWLVQQGIPVIPKSSNVDHMRANLDLFSFELSQQEMLQLTRAKTPSTAGGPDGTSGDCPIKMQEPTLFA
jgi:diketogulonate reductase-like aldo/keto reductase